MPNSRRRVSSRKHLLIALLAFSSLTSGERAFAAGALPSGGQFAAGAGSIAAAANGVNVTQSTSSGVINWQSFSIGQGNTVNIANGAGATLNRVTGGDISSIAGSLTSTGSVYVINHAGVLVTPTGRVNTVGTFVASTRDIADSSFMAGGAQNFVGNSAGTVVNQGSITSANGDVILVGKSVENSGQIAAPNGNAILAAGDNVVLQPAGGDSQILISAGSGDVTNTGAIYAAQAELNAAGGNVYALASNNGGIIRASGTSLKDGHVYLTGGDDVTVDGAVTATNADGSGGTIKATGGAGAGTLNVTASLDASATGSTAKGGTIIATAATVTVGPTAKIAADGGGNGGTVLIGGDRHGGSDPSVALSATPIANAQQTTVAAGAQISADGGKLGGSGNGGNVVVWSDQSTTFAGAISAQGGATGGNGGFVEVSGDQLNYSGSVNTLAPSGIAGTLLLDPQDVYIVSRTDNTPQDGVSSYLLNTTIDNTLDTTDVTITSAGKVHFGDPNGTNGSNSAPLYWTSNQNLTINAAVVIDTNGGNPTSATGTWTTATGATPTQAAGALAAATAGNLIDTSGSGNITLNGGGAGLTGLFSGANGSSLTNGPNVITLTSTIVANGGTITLEAASVSSGGVVTPSGGFTVTVGNGAFVKNTGGNIVLQSDYIRLGSGQTFSGEVDDPTGTVTVKPSTPGSYVIGNVDPNSPDNTSDNFTANTAFLNFSSIYNTNGGSTGGIHANDLVIGSTDVTNLSLQSPTYVSNNGSFTGVYATVNNLELLTKSTGSVTQDSRTPIFVAGVNPDPSFVTASGGLAVVSGTVNLPNFLNATSTLAINATGNVVFQGNSVNAFSPTTADSGTLSIGTVNGVSGISGSNVTLINVGSTTQDTSSSSNAITATNLVLEGGATGNFANYTYTDYSAQTYPNGAVSGISGTFKGNYTLDNTSNSIGSVAGKVGTLSLHDNTALTINSLSDNYSSTVTNGASGSTTYGATTFNGITGTGALTIVDNGLLTIANQSPVKTTSGNVNLEDTTFANSYTQDPGGAADATGAFQVSGGGTWRVYSDHPTTGNVGGLTSSQYGFVIYEAPNDYTTPFTNANTRLTAVETANPGATTGLNGFLYAVTPTVTEYVTNTFTKVYDGNANLPPGTGNVTLTYSFINPNNSNNTGPINGDTVSVTKPSTEPNAGFYSASFSTPATGVTSPHVGTYNLAIPVSLVSATDTQNVPVYGYTLTSTAAGVATITPATLTISGAKTYDGQATAPLADINTTTIGATAVTGLVGSDSFGTDLTLLGTAGVTGSPNKGTYTGATGPTAFTLGTTGGLTLSGAASGDYTLAAGTFTINAATLTISGAKTYDGQATAPLADINTTTIGATAVTGLVGSDSFGTDLTLSGAGTTGSPNAATYTGSGVGTANFGLGGLSLSGLGSGNYTLAAGTFTINPAALTITASAQSKVYGTTTGTLLEGAQTTDFTTSALQNGESVSGVTLTPTAAALLATTDAGTTGLVNTPSAATGSGTFLASNYNITYNTGAITITPAQLTASGTKTYDGTVNFASSNAGQLVLAGGVNNQTVTLSAGGTATSSSPNANSYTSTTFTPNGFTVTGGSGNDLTSNYTLPTTAALTINRAPLTITASAQSKVYGTTTGTLLEGAQTTDFTTSALQNGESVSGVTLTPTAAALLATTDAGTTGLVNTPSGATGSGTFLASNYNITYNTGAITITPAQLTASGTKTYDGTVNFASSNAGQLVLAGGVNNQTVTLSAGGTATSSSPNANSYTSTTFTPNGFTVTGGTGNDFTSNYTLPTTAALTINRATLTISGQKTYDTAATAPAADINQTTTGNFALTGLVSGDAFGAGGDLALSGTGVTGSANAGTYTGSTPPTSFTLGGLTLGAGTNGDASGNYILAAGTFKINTALLTVTTANGTRAYDGTTNAPAADITLAGLQGSDATGPGGDLSLAGSGFTGSPNKGIYTGSTGPTSFTLGTLALGAGTNGDVSGNYTLQAGTFTITAANLTITASAQSKVYGTTTGTLLEGAQTTDFTTSALQNGESVSGVTLTPTAAALLATTDAGTTGLVNTPSAATGSGTFLASNYNITYNTGAITITPAQLTASGTKTYDGTVNFASSNAGQLVLAGGVNNQTVTLSAGGTATSSSPNANSYTSTTFTPNGFTVTGGSGNDLTSNYTLPTTAALTINRAPLTITPNSTSKTYGTALTFGGTEFTASGLVNNQTVGSVTLTSAGTPATASVAGSPYAINGANATGGTFNPSNYSITYNTGTLTVNPLAVTVTGTRNYDGTPNAPGTILSVIGEIPNDPTLTLTGTGTLQSPNANPSTPTTITSLGNLTLTGAGSSNYVLTGGTVTIDPAPLSITANNQTKTYGSTLTFAGTEFTPSGLQGSDTVGTVTLVSAGAPATASVAGSPYVITPSAATGGTFIASNYTITYNPGTLTVNPLGVTVIGKRVYDGTPNAPGTILTVVGEIPGDPTLTTTGTGTLQSPNVNPADPITSLGTLVLTGTGSSNYVLNGGTVAITPAALTITANNQTKTYGTALTFAGTEFTSSGLQGSDTIGRVTLVSPGAPATAAVAGSPYAITPSAATGGTFAASNYTIRYVAGTLTINPLAVTVTGTRLFDGGTDASGTILTVLGEIPGDPTLTLSGVGTLAGPDANAIPTPITALGTLALVGPGSTNYVLTSGAVLITAPVTQVNVPDQTSAGAGVQTVGVFTNGVLLPRPQQNGVVGGKFATGAGCEDSNTQCDVPTNGAAAAEATGTQSGTELISGKNNGKGS